MSPRSIGAVAGAEEGAAVTASVLVEGGIILAMQSSTKARVYWSIDTCIGKKRTISDLCTTVAPVASR